MGARNSSCHCSYPSEEAILIGMMLEGTTAVSIKEFRIYLPHRYKSKIQNVEPLISFPIILLKRGSKIVKMQQLDCTSKELGELFGMIPEKETEGSTCTFNTNENMKSCKMPTAERKKGTQLVGHQLFQNFQKSL